MIPDDILIEIFSQLPSTSLLRLRWTCKYWFDLLRNPGFIKMHLHRHHYQSSSSTSHLLLISKRSRSRSRVVVSYSVKCSDFFINLSSPLPPPPKTDYCNLPVRIDRLDQFLSLGSCNGLICFYTLLLCTKVKYFLWNPSTREFKMLPHLIRRKSNDDYSHFHGFGYDHTIDDYKIIDILILYGDGGGGGGGVVYPEININIYTLGSNSWSKKIITDQSGYFAPNNIIYQTNGSSCFLNGALHWLTDSGILRFDIVEEQEQEQLLQPPNNGGDDRGGGGSSNWFRIYRSKLEVLNGCLCVMNYVETEEFNDDKDIVELWMMRDYGVNESWTKLFTIDPQKSSNICGSWYLNELKPIELCKDGGILMLFNDYYLVLYDLKNKRHRWVHYIHSIEYAYISESYKESMVSLKSGIYLTNVGSTTSVQEEFMMTSSSWLKKKRKRKGKKKIKQN